MLGFMKHTKKFSLSTMDPTRFYGAEDGLPGGGSGLDDAGSGVAVIERNEDGFSKEEEAILLQNDPEYAELINAEKREVAANKDLGEKGKKPEEGNLEEEEESSLVDDKAKVEKKVEKEPESIEGFDDLEFEDDAIPGLKGEDLKKLGPNAAMALADYHEKTTEATAKLAETKSALENLLADPVVKARKEMIDNGKTAYDVRQITPDERQTAINRLVQKIDFTPEEAATAFDELRSGFETIVKQSVEGYIQNRVLETAAQQKASETIHKARSVFLGFGQFNKDLEFKETDPNKFWKKDSKEQDVLDESHPEAEKFRKFVIPVMQALGKSGLSYDGVLKLAEEIGSDGLYAIAAKKLNLPVAINTKKRDQKMVALEVQKRFKSFLKSNASEELPADGDNTNSSGKKGKDNMLDGIDLDRILDDESYVDQVMRKKADPKWIDRVEEIQDKARSIRAQKAAKNKKK